MALPVLVEFHIDEVPESLCDRLSVANGFSSKRVFMSMTGIKAGALAKAEPAAIARLANWSGEDAACLATNCVTTHRRRVDWRLGNALFNKQSRRGRRFRYCPNCVLDDIETGGGRPVAVRESRMAVPSNHELRSARSANRRSAALS